MFPSVTFNDVHFWRETPDILWKSLQIYASTILYLHLCNDPRIHPYVLHLLNTKRITFSLLIEIFWKWKWPNDESNDES